MSQDDELLSNLWDALKSAIAFFLVFRFAPAPLSVFKALLGALGIMIIRGTIQGVADFFGRFRE